MGIPRQAASGANDAEQVITIPAVTSGKITLEQIAWSYDGTPTGGGIKVESPAGTELYGVNITGPGPDSIGLGNTGIDSALGQAMVVRLAAAGTGIVGKVNAIQRS